MIPALKGGLGPVAPFRACLALLAIQIVAVSASAQERPRARDLGIIVGVLPPGPLNAITDVTGARVGHVTLARGHL